MAHRFVTLGLRVAGALLGVSLGLSSYMAKAQPEVERFYPPVIEAGTEALVKIEGKFPSWPVRFFCDRSDVTIACDEKPGQIKLTTKQETHPGPLWLRCYDAKGASNLLPLVIERCPVVPEAEPNDALQNGTPLKLPAIAVGRLEKNGDVDLYRIDVTTDKDLVVSVAANQLLKSPMDTVLQIIDDHGNVLAQCDDERGLDPQLVYRPKKDGVLLARVFAFPETPNSTIGFAGGSNFVYTISATQEGFFDHVLPLVCSDPKILKGFGWNSAIMEIATSEANSIAPRIAYSPNKLGWCLLPNDDSNVQQLFETEDVQPTKATLPTIISGHLEKADDIDRLDLQVPKGQKIRAKVICRDFGFAADTALRFLTATNADELARNDDGSRQNYDAMLDYTPKDDESIQLQIFDALGDFGPRQAYSVRIEKVEPEVRLLLADDHFRVEPGKSVEILLTIERRDGYDKQLEFEIEALPPSVEIEKTISEPKGDSAKSVKLKLNAAEDAKEFQGTIKIRGIQADESKASVAAKYPLNPTFTISEVWLTVSAK